MKINIFGSTGTIGVKSLKILKKNFSNIKINLLFANNNYKKIISQAKIYKPKYICIKNSDYNKFHPLYCYFILPVIKLIKKYKPYFRSNAI